MSSWRRVGSTSNCVCLRLRPGIESYDYHGMYISNPDIDAMCFSKPPLWTGRGNLDPTYFARDLLMLRFSSNIEMRRLSETKVRERVNWDWRLA